MSDIEDEVLTTCTFIFSCYEYSKAKTKRKRKKVNKGLEFFWCWRFYNSVFTNFKTTLFWEHHIMLLLKNSLTYEKRKISTEKWQLTFETMKSTLFFCFVLIFFNLWIKSDQFDFIRNILPHFFMDF